MHTKHIKDLRIDRDLTQSDIAKILNISRQYYCRYENGEVEIPMRHMITLAKFYNISLDYLADLTNIPMPLYREAQLSDSAGDEMDLLCAYRKSPKHIKEAIQKLLQI